MKRIKEWRIWSAVNVWVAVLLLGANGWAWLRSAATSNLPEVPPIIHPGVDELRRNWNSGEVIGQPFSVTVTDEETAQTIMWFVAPRPSIPLSRPQVRLTPSEISGRAVMVIGGLQVEVFGRGMVRLVNGRPIIDVYEVGVGNANMPAFVMAALQSQVDQAQATYDQLALPIELTKLEIGEGWMTIEGVYKER